MNIVHTPNAAAASVVVALLLAPLSALASQLDFRVGFAEVPGIEEIEAGQFRQAIEILESRRRDPQSQYIDEELTTLCGVYIVAGELGKARKVCDEAVDKDRTDAAWNNRGVLRVHSGDTAGALRDFSRVRVPPTEYDGYIAELLRRNPRLMATGNYELAAKIRGHGMDGHEGRSFNVRGASVETIDR